jgi:hypothetical protein
MVDSDTRNARAMSRVATPHTKRSVSATRASGASAGWQHMKIRRNRSSGMTSSGSPAAGAVDSSSSMEASPVSSSEAMSSGSLERNAVSRRIASIARRWARVVSQAPGLRGMPSSSQACSADAYASCTHSSARSRSRATRIVAASTRAHSRRCVSAIAASTAAASVTPSLAPRFGRSCCAPVAPRHRRRSGRRG